MFGFYNTYYKEVPEITTHSGEYFLNGILVNTDCYYVNYDENSQKILIEDYNSDIIFHGKCLDIETFRYLCKILEIYEKKS